MTTASAEGPGRRIAVIGDLAGHLDELRTELARLGADERTGRLPPNLVVIQVGDLVHRGPASDGVIALVDRYLTEQPEQWIQLVGNHEAQYLARPAFDWPERISAEAIETLRRWWGTGQMRAAASLLVEGEAFLVTHAGLTAGFWRESLGAPARAEHCAAALNALIGTDDEALFRAGHMLRGRKADRGNATAGPIWAAAATELLPGWLGTTLPFSQVHGHTTIYDWQRREFRTLGVVGQFTTVDEDAKHETTDLDGGRIIGVDPGHADRARRPWRAWEAYGFLDPVR